MKKFVLVYNNETQKYSVHSKETYNKHYLWNSSYICISEDDNKKHLEEEMSILNEQMHEECTEYTLGMQYFEK